MKSGKIYSISFSDCYGDCFGQKTGLAKTIMCFFHFIKVYPLKERPDLAEILAAVESLLP